jgi:hypothetical protein
MNGTMLTRYKDTIFVPLPISEWRIATGQCCCDVCKADGGRTASFWDTLVIAAKEPKRGYNDYASVCHHPGLHSQAKRIAATLEYIAAHLS